MNIQELDPLVEVTHLRRLLDTQPSCLMRLGADGTVLAASDAALKLIGATSPAQALGRDFSAWVPSDQRDRWTAFTTGVARGCPASVECDIEAPSGDRQPTLFHGVPLTDHPDGVASMAIAVRAVSGQRQLEAAVIELEGQLRERDAERVAARARLAELESRQRELAEKARAAEAAQVAAEAKAAQALADVQQLELALDAFAARQKQGTAHAGLAAAHALLTKEHDRLVRSLHQMVAQMEALANGFPAAAAAVEHVAPGGFGTDGEEGPA